MRTLCRRSNPANSCVRQSWHKSLTYGKEIFEEFAWFVHFSEEQKRHKQAPQLGACPRRRRLFHCLVPTVVVSKQAKSKCGITECITNDLLAVVARDCAHILERRGAAHMVQ